MSSARITKLLLLCGLATTSFGAAQQAVDQPPPTPTISQSSPKPTFEVDLHNPGKQPLYLNAWNRVSGMPVNAIHLSITDDKGKTIPLIVRDPNADNPPGVVTLGVQAGYMILQPGQSNTFPVDLENYSSSGGASHLSLAPGRYIFKAIYIGEDFHYDIGHRFWIGTVQSNALPFTIPQKAGQ